jgi:outer membrane biosynthesis protein TonB
LGYFTGASILYRHSASYADTSLAASADKTKEENELNFEELLAHLKEFVGGEIKSLKDELKPKEEVAPEAEPVAEPEAEPAAEPVVEAAPAQAEPEVVVEPEADPTPDQAVTPEPEAAPAEPVAEPAAEPVAEPATLNASSLLAEIDALKAEIKTLKEETNLHAAARKSILYPTSALAKYETDGSDKSKIMASIEANTELSIEERLALKLEALAKQN